MAPRRRACGVHREQQAPLPAAVPAQGGARPAGRSPRRQGPLPLRDGDRHGQDAHRSRSHQAPPAVRQRPARPLPRRSARTRGSGEEGVRCPTSADYQTVIYKESRDDWRRAEIVVTTDNSFSLACGTSAVPRLGVLGSGVGPLGIDWARIWGQSVIITRTGRRWTPEESLWQAGAGPRGALRRTFYARFRRYLMAAGLRPTGLTSSPQRREAAAGCRRVGRDGQRVPRPLIAGGDDHVPAAARGGGVPLWERVAMAIGLKSGRSGFRVTASATEVLPPMRQRCSV